MPLRNRNRLPQGVRIGLLVAGAVGLATGLPLRFLVAHHDASTVHAFFEMADVYVVSPLHDGMNLVAKAYVAAKTGGDGVLVLSEFAGAARELSEALLINPCDAEQFADAIHEALTMEPGERQTRMRSMQAVVEKHNEYAWAASFLACLTGTHSRIQRPNGYGPQAGSTHRRPCMTGSTRSSASFMRPRPA